MKIINYTYLRTIITKNNFITLKKFESLFKFYSVLEINARMK